MNDIQILQKTNLLGHNLTVYGTMEQPLFLAPEVASWLELSNVTDMVSRVDEDERSKFNLGRQGDTWFLTENGVYEVLMQSRKPIAKQFKSGVKKILHEIRVTGGYITTKEEDTPEVIMARALKIANETMKRHKMQIAQLTQQNQLQEHQLQEAAPKVNYVDTVLQSVNTYTTTQVAKELGMDAQKLNKTLHDKGVLFKQSGQWLLMSKYQNKDYTHTRTQTYTRNDGSIGTSSYTVWTEKGRRFIHEFMAVEYN